MKYPEETKEWSSGPAVGPGAYSTGRPEDEYPTEERCKNLECQKLVWQKYLSDYWCVAAGGKPDGLPHCPLGKFQTGRRWLDDTTYLDGVDRFKTGELVLGYGRGQIHHIWWSRDKAVYCRAIINCIQSLEISDEEVDVIEEWLKEEDRKDIIENAILDMRNQVPTDEIRKELERRGHDGL